MGALSDGLVEHYNLLNKSATDNLEMLIAILSPEQEQKLAEKNILVSSAKRHHFIYFRGKTDSRAFVIANDIHGGDDVHFMIDNMSFDNKVVLVKHIEEIIFNGKAEG